MTETINPAGFTPNRASFKDIRIDQIPFTAKDKNELLEIISHTIMANAGFLNIYTINPEFYYIAKKDKYFKSILVENDVNVADGSGIILAARRQGCNSLKRIPGRILFNELLLLAAAQQARVFLFGSTKTVLNSIGEKAAKLYPKIQLFWHAPDYFESSSIEEKKATQIVMEKISACQPKILLLALGTPKQELWLAKNRAALRTLGVCVSIGVGGAFDYFSGQTAVPPQWISKIGLEWLFRLWKDPRKRFSRQIKSLPWFCYHYLLRPKKINKKGERDE
jgi:N-acetylglucosaminyldiphosphoundecaprenol N-acetyl-beta-D-mannosaminyltransferase